MTCVFPLTLWKKTSILLKKVTMSALPPTPTEELSRKMLDQLKEGKFHNSAQEAQLKILQSQLKSLQTFETPSKLNKICENIVDCQKNDNSRNKIFNLIRLFSDLALYAFDNPVETYNSYAFEQTIKISIHYLNINYPESLREAIIVYLTNSFQSESFSILDKYNGEGIITILYQAISLNGSLLNFPALRCLTSIAAHSEEYRNKVKECVKIRDASNLLNILENPREKKQIIRLLHAYILYPLEDAEFEDILNIFKLNTTAFHKQTYLALIDFASDQKHADAILKDEIFMQEQFTNLRDILVSQLIYTVVMNTSKVVSFRVEPFLRDYSPEVSVLNIQTLSNSIINSVVMQQEIIEKIDLIKNKYEANQINLKIKREIILFIGTFIRSLTSEKVLLLKPSDFLDYLVDSLDYNDSEVIINSLCAINKYASAFPTGDAKAIRDKFIDLGGVEKIEELKDIGDDTMNDYIYAFEKSFLASDERVPFNFEG